MRYKKEKNTLIKYKWETGAYGIKEMKQLVKDGIITENQFFDITRYYYNGIQENKRVQKEFT